MTLDDAAAILDITEKSVVRLIREEKIEGHQSKKMRKGARWVWVIDGASVRARRRLLDRKILDRWSR